MNLIIRSSECEIDMLGEVVAKEEGFKEIEDEFSRFGSKSID